MSDFIIKVRTEELIAKADEVSRKVGDMQTAIDDAETLMEGLNIRFVQEHSFTPEALVNELKPAERAVFRLLFTGSAYGKIYRLLEFALD